MKGFSCWVQWAFRDESEPIGMIRLIAIPASLLAAGPLGYFAFLAPSAASSVLVHLGLAISIIVFLSLVTLEISRMLHRAAMGNNPRSKDAGRRSSSSRSGNRSLAFEKA